MRKYVVHYFKPESHHYAFHTTHSWLWTKFILWMIKRHGYNDAYMEIYNADKITKLIN